MTEYRITDIYVFTGIRRGKKFKSYQFQYKIMDENTGTWPKHFKKVTNQDKKKLRIERDALEKTLQSQVQVIQDAYFEDIAEKALDVRKMSIDRTVKGIRARSFDNDQRHFNLHLRPYFGGKSIRKITTGDINLFIDSMANSGKSAKLIRHCIGTLNMILKYAINKGYIAVNPNNPKERDKISGGEKERGGYSHDHIASMIKGVENSTYFKCFVMFSAFTGLSANELQGLQWGDICFNSKTVTVNRTVDNKGNVQDTKNFYRVRTLGLPDGLVQILKEWKLKSHCDLWVFPNAYGKKTFEQNAMRKNIKKICDLAGVPDYGIGGFRKYYNTSMISEVPDHIRKARMGHSKHSTTAETNYTIVDLEQARDAKQADQLMKKVLEV